MSAANDSVPLAPSPSDVAGILRLIEPLRRLINPKVLGIEHVPEQRALLVGNHNTLGLVDAPLLCAELWERGRMVRALGDHAHFRMPVWRDVMARYGVVDGTRSTTSTLMDRGDLVMVFPGGGREVSKRKGERYKLVWKNRLGFARLAIAHQYPIVPFASVGAEHGIDILLDADHPLLAPLRGFAERVLATPDMPLVVKGIGLTPLPRPERQYYWFGPPIDTTRYAGRESDDRAARAVREETAAAIERGIELLLRERAEDPHRSLTARLVGPERRGAPSSR